MLSEKSEAVDFNAKVLRKLQKALKADPEANLLSLLPTEYSERLIQKQRPREYCYLMIYIL